MKKILKPIIIILLVSCLGLALFPSTSKAIYNYQYTQNEKEFINKASKKKSDKKSKIDIERLYQDSIRYNKSLIGHQVLTDDFCKACLNLSDYGIEDNIYGYIKIDSINLTLPIYLGSSDYNMSLGATQLMNTSLPISQSNTNCVLSGHTGYLGKTFFDNIPSLNIGDKVIIENFFENIEYIVTDYKEIGNQITDDCFIHNNKQELTLVTCANYGRGRYVIICQNQEH